MIIPTKASLLWTWKKELLMTVLLTLLERQLTHHIHLTNSWAKVMKETKIQDHLQISLMTMAPTQSLRHHRGYNLARIYT